ncbi:chorismate mutase [Nitrosophilus alvini]|uniref:chorismate mutase n=1 Tax=Nitrosophilus alvini TaxID=2714855 RepID=UPI0019096657|nr:chorismate mutase [Nitrosophilus alvini]
MMRKFSSLEEVRKAVDDVDEEIVKLLAKRSGYIKEAAKFKKSVDEIKSDERVEEVLDHVSHLAATLGISPNMVTELYKILIDKMVEMEIEEFKGGGAY